MYLKLKSFIIVILLLAYSCDKNDIFETQTIYNSELLDKESDAKDEISVEIAKSVALNFISRNNEKSKGTYKIKSSKSIKDYNGNNAVYIINLEPEGYTLVSSNKKNIPIIAYSDKGEFELNENSPDGLKSWLAMTIIINNELEKMDKASKEIENKWSSLVVVNSAPPIDDEIVTYSHTVTQQYGPLLQTSWHQGYPYNYYTNNCPTGCVAVATAQVMKYHQWPSSFDWSIMPNTTSSVTTGSLEVAELMADIGENVNMDYTPSGSGAYTSDARDALVNNYQYSSEAYYSGYDFNITKNEIKLNRPVIMNGYHTYYTTTSGWWIFKKTTHHYEDGHSWVCDGYKKQYDVYIHNPDTYYEYTSQENIYEWLHMNWGWSNAAGNGWFFNNNIFVGNVYIDVNGEFVHPNFQYERHCIYKIKK